MRQDQIEHVEGLLIDMMEKLPKDLDVHYTPEALRAAADAAHALIALHNAARPVEEKAPVAEAPAPEKGGAPPYIKALIDEFRAKTTTPKLTADAAWELVREAIRSCDAAAAFRKLPPEVAKVVKHPHYLYEWGMMYDKYPEVIAMNFKNTFREARGGAE